ncbi:MAG: sigma-54-dependent Fis family transcriptional regulator [Ignavibacteriales bacterium]|nr:sigma-54-dependent Fis family transcriptional regulator [Ignavibacteriales bacterium]
MKQILEQLIQEKNIAYAIYDDKLNLYEISSNLQKMLNLNEVKFEDSLFDTFPEFFGSEKEIYNVQSGKSLKLLLEKINRKSRNNGINYFDFAILKLKEKNNFLLLIVNDSTKESTLLQKINQQQNEIKILKESFNNLKKDSIENILGNSKQINSVKNFIRKVASVRETSILLTGESGTGKTLIARAIHNLTLNDEAPFVEINCATIPDALLESEIFGHVKGAFTNALENKKGLLEEANGGTLFLDEIGELPISLQPKLLTFLETKKYRAVGSTKENQVNVRIITATNRDLKKAVNDKEFREDLFYRINVVNLEIPPLRERENDILILADHFIKNFSNEFCKNNLYLSKDAVDKLLQHSWPGNIRELKNVIERTLIFCEKSEIEYDDIVLFENTKIKKVNNECNIPDYGISLEEIEKKYLENALTLANGNQSKAAKLLNLTLDTFRYRIKKFNIS